MDALRNISSKLLTTVGQDGHRQVSGGLNSTITMVLNREQSHAIMICSDQGKLTQVENNIFC